MKITILGSGAAFGVPTIFNVWGKADSKNPHNTRTRASILLEERGKTILIDAGPDFRQQINRENVKNIDAVFVTHGHYDHIGGIPELPRAAKILGHGIDVHASAETMSELRSCYGYLFKEKADAEPDSKSIKWCLLPDSGNFTAVGLPFETILFQHHHIHSSAFRYQKFAYVTDWQTLPDEAAAFLTGLDLLIMECNNGTETEENGHSNIYKVKEVIEKYTPKRVILSHLSTRIDENDFQKHLPPNCELSYDGMVIEI